MNPNRSGFKANIRVTKLPLLLLIVVFHWCVKSSSLAIHLPTSGYSSSNRLLHWTWYCSAAMEQGNECDHDQSEPMDVNKNEELTEPDGQPSDPGAGGDPVNLESCKVEDVDMEEVKNEAIQSPADKPSGQLENEQMTNKQSTKFNEQLTNKQLTNGQSLSSSSANSNLPFQDSQPKILPEVNLESCKVEDVQMEEVKNEAIQPPADKPSEQLENEQITNKQSTNEQLTNKQLTSDQSLSSLSANSELPSHDFQDSPPKVQPKVSTEPSSTDQKSSGSHSQDHSSPSQAVDIKPDIKGESHDSKELKQQYDVSSDKSVQESVKELSLKKADSEATATEALNNEDSKEKLSLKAAKWDEEEDEILEFPKTLEEFGFRFNDENELRSIEKDEPFEFCVKEDNHFYNQKRYEALGELITDHVYHLLEEVGLKRIYIPLDAKDGAPKSFFFMSPGALQKETLIMIIHGSGVVRAGQWSRKLIINNDLDKGTQLPYIKFGLEQNFGVIVLNTNLNRAMATIGGKQVEQPIECSRFPETHAFYVWDKFIENSAVKHIAIVAHSYGGIVASYLAEDRSKDFHKRVFAIAFTDSVHSLPMIDASKNTQSLFFQCAVNWVSSDLPLDTEMPHQSHRQDARRISAGHEQHEWTSYAAMESVFCFIKEKHDHRIQNPNSDSSCTNL